MSLSSYLSKIFEYLNGSPDTKELNSTMPMSHPVSLPPVAQAEVDAKPSATKPSYQTKYTAFCDDELLDVKPSMISTVSGKENQMMDPALKSIWIKRLRSGEYLDRPSKQYALRTTSLQTGVSGWDPCGVLLDVVRNWIWIGPYNPLPSITPKDNAQEPHLVYRTVESPTYTSCTIPYKITSELGVPVVVLTQISRFRDNGCTNIGIADWIEKYL